MSGLKPCPFCGFRPTLKDYVYRFFWEKPTIYYYVHCECCGVKTELCENELIAMTKWNRRVGDADI